MSGKVRQVTRTFYGGAGLGLLVLVMGAAAALAAAHFSPGKRYEAKSGSCSPGAIRGTTCTFIFKASASGGTLHFVGKTVVDSWGCGNGGGEALLGGKAKGATPIPDITVDRAGSLSGSVSYVFRPTSAPPERHTYTVSGRISRSGKSATFTLHDHLKGSRSCSVGPVDLRETGT